MFNVAIIGAGRIGSSIAKLLYHTHNYQLLVIDSKAEALDQFSDIKEIKTCQLDLHDKKQLLKALSGYSAVISACPYNESVDVAQAALEIGASYFDLTEDVKASEAIYKMSAQAKKGQVFVPQCGLAPGFISILAAYIFNQFDEINDLKLRVGALPEFPSNLMMYNLTWSTDGLINEYCNPCPAIKHGKQVELIPLEGLENFSLDGVEFEAFNTSGGLGTLCRTLDGKVENLNYKTVRYKGHQHLMSFLIGGLKLGKRQQLLKKIFENAVATTMQDVVVILVSGTGIVDGQLRQISESRRIYHADIFGEHWSAIQITTAASICAVVDLFFNQQLPEANFIKQEDIPFDLFINNRFGKYFQTHNS
ncbi:MAG: saccharopine dehydrogenase NADP-binding domain-containing protein [Proteobacteria bacterium]|nr:saccharopine dehydrogenase NADP-binding domain-containing protein [Pseudomonadota bacterium]